MASELLIGAMGATLAGSVFGDHCSPISDTTILSSTGAKCEHIRHVSTQIPYALTVAVNCFLGYVIYGLAAPLTSGPWLALGSAIALLVATLLVIRLMQKKKQAA